MPLHGEARALDRYIFNVLLAIVVIAPIPFASVHLWAWSLFSLVTSVLILAWAVSAHFGQSNISDISRLCWTSIGLFSAGMAWAFLQSSPILPVAWHHPVWKDAAEILNLPYHGSVSLDPARSVQNITRLLSAACIFWLSFQYCRKPDNARRAVQVLSISNFAIAAYGLLEFFSHRDMILWMPKYAYFGDLTATFINRNNYATFAGIGWLCFLALFFRGYENSILGVRSKSEKIRELLKYMERRGIYLMIGILVQASALLLSHSRAGFASTIVGILMLCVCLAVNRRSDRASVYRFTGVALFLAIIFYVASGAGLDERLGQTTIAEEDRLEVYEKTEIAIGNQPILGTGLGTFEEVFRFYRPASFLKTFDYAHNSYLELALELGIPAAVSIILSVGIVIALMIRGVIVRKNNSLYPCLGVSVAALVGTHSLFDFSVQIPAVAYIFSFLLGLGLAQSVSLRRVERAAT